MEKRIITNINELTPVDIYNQVGGFNKMYFKRDDLFCPYHDMVWLGGGKLRQSITLFETLKDELKNYNGIISYVSVGSPQAIIIAKVAKEFGHKTTITIGVNDELNAIIKKHKPITECVKIGTEVINVAKIGYNTVLKSRTEDIAKERNLYIIHFGINIEEKTLALTQSVSDQVQNIPGELDVMVVPVGSGIQLAAILHGIKKYNKKVDRVIGIQISGYDRSKTIDNILKNLDANDMKYEQIIDKTHPYSHHIETHISDMKNWKQSLDLNVVYEAKAWEYIKKHKKELKIDKDAEILYWIVGNNNLIYH